MAKCNYCSKEEEKLQRCSACKQVYYCSAQHQRSDWTNHKSVCKQLQEQPKEVNSKYAKQIPTLKVSICF